MAVDQFLDASELDFDTLKSNLKTFLEGQEQFSDYDFEGSNLSALIDLLTYNTYINSLYLNQIGSEMFLDTSTQRDSLVSHSKELNYLPTGKLSAVSNVTFSVNTGITNASLLPTSVTIPKNFELTTTIGENNYIFTVPDSLIVTTATLGSDNVYRYFANNVQIFEGNIRTEVFVSNTSSNTPASFVLSSANVDTRSIEVTVQVSNTDTTNSTYTRAESLLGLTPTSEIFFLQGAEDFKYEITFGNNITGKNLNNGNLIKVSYRDCNATEPNSANVFTTSGTVNGYSTSIITNSAAELGSEHETADSIRFNAPRHFATQGRAVTASDYKSLVTSNFPQFQTVSVYGGDEEDSPRYGKVIVSVKPALGRTKLTDIEKSQIIEFLKPRSPLSIDPLVEDALFNRLEITSLVTYNTTNTIQSTNDIKSKILTAITNFNSNNLGNFGSVFRYSKFSTVLDNADNSILSNDTTMRIFREIVPVESKINSFTIAFENQLDEDEAERCLFSTNFTYDGDSSFFQDDGAGNVQIISQKPTGRIIKNALAGTVNYTTGAVTINNLDVINYEGESIRLYARLEKKDIKSSRNIILEIDEIENDITVVGTTADQ
jgi:hypothetical protein